ncbi:MAG TPA: CHAT domain-containing protein [Pyrinomonadaceae bacterium]
MDRLLRLSSSLLLLFLISVLALSWPPAHAQDDGLVEVESLTSVASRRRALEDLASAVGRLRRDGDSAALVRALDRISEIHLKLNDPDSALPAASEALALARRVGDSPLLADALIASGVAYRAREESDTSLRLLNEADGLSQSLNYRRGEAQSLTELGTTYFQQADMEKAVGCGERALQVWRELQDRRGEARVLYNLGAPYMRLGRVREAADVLAKAAAIWRDMGNPTEQAAALLDLNFLAIRQGQWHRALALLNEAGTLVTDKEAEPFISGQIATSLGEVYEAFGQLETARRYFEEALTLYRDYAHDEAAVIDVGGKAGSVLARLDDYPGALRQLEEGLQLAQASGNGFLLARCHEDLGRVHLASGLHAEARQEFLLASTGYARIGDRRAWAQAQAYLGQTHHVLGDRVSASNSYQASLEVFREFEDYTNEAAVQFGLGKLELERQNLGGAEEHLTRSIELTERLRENAAGKDLRSSFLASVHDRYVTYVEWLMQLNSTRPGEGFDVKAFEASELGRARSLLDSLRDYQRELRGTQDPALLIEEEELQKKEQTLLDRQARLQSQGAVPEETRKVEDELTQVRTRRETLEARMNGDARFNDLLRPAPLSLGEIRRQVTDAETSLLEFSLGDRRSYLWLITQEGMTSYELPDRRTIEAAALRLAKLFDDQEKGLGSNAEVEAAAAEVSRLVLTPVAGRLRTQRLIIVPDGVLQYVPFQILTDASDTGEPLVARHEIVNAPSASTLVLLRRENAGRPEAPKLLAAFGAPAVLSNYVPAASNRHERSGTTSLPEAGGQPATATKAADTLDPNRIGSLFFAKQELNVLRKLATTDEALIYSGFDATRERLRDLDLQQYRILHFATHGLLNAEQPELSGLVLSLVDKDGRPLTGFVGLSDIYNLRAPVDLVVLSACRSALGDDVRGEGLVGLTRGFMYAGASSVVASLWKVDDEATAELMKRFYSNMLERDMTPAAALREAQNSIRQEPQWSSPYYWAAFTLQGEYRHVIKPPGRVSASRPMKVSMAVMILGSLGVAAWWLIRRRGKLSARAAAAATRS